MNKSVKKTSVAIKPVLVLVVFMLFFASNVFATDVAYIVRDNSKIEVNVINEIQTLGLSYDIIDDSDISTTNFSNYEMVLLGDGNIKNAPVEEYKSLIMNPNYYSLWSGSIGSSTSSAVFNLENSITEGILVEFNAYNVRSGQIYYLTAQKYSNSVTVKGDSASDRGKFVVAKKISPRRIFWGITKSDLWSEESKELFKNAVHWILHGEDVDSDGFYSDIDCDDNNSSKWQYFDGYVDSDSDGFGNGNLIPVCSGNELAVGYSEIGLDCNDNNLSINPEALEIPYNSIDEDCINGDLVDVDNDSFIGDAVGGDDCNDLDPDYNILSTDIYKNCLNDAPIVSEIEDISVEEGEEVIISIEALDPESDNLTYSVNDSRFIQDEEEGIVNNVFVWQTGAYDSENYTFIVNVSDGELSSNVEVKVEVKNVNQAPVCDFIPVFEWNEDNNYTLNLSDFCYDLDSTDSVKFYFENITNNENIILESIDMNSSIVNFSVKDNWFGEESVVFRLSDGVNESLTSDILLKVLPINDMPIVEYIETININEGESAIIVIEAYDLENDILTYSVNDSRFIQINTEGNEFVWQTGAYDNGEYIFIINISDGELTFSLEVEIVVANKNQAPICDEIPDLEWDEDENSTFNLSNFCYDLDPLDSIGFYFNETSSEENIALLDIDKNTGIINFSSTKDWNGEDWIVFKVFDGKNDALTERITLRVLPVNDAPIFNGSIENITWQEDTNLTNAFDLNDYFSDIDLDSISFEVSGNDSIIVNINNEGIVSFFTKKDWFGIENIIFSATDEMSGIIYSNSIELNVVDANEPPVFLELNCENSILEDEEYECELNASDIEEDDFDFSVTSEENIQCEVENGVLHYVSDLNYNGVASCNLRVSDEWEHSDFLFEVDVLNVNDAPSISSFSPSLNSLKIMENTNQLFNVDSYDIDGDSINISWFLDSIKVFEGESYTFNEEKEFYSLEAFVSDYEKNSSHKWNVSVGDISDFSCSEIQGYVCSDDEICRLNNLGVSDSAFCCPVRCSEKPPEFNDLSKCSDDNLNLSSLLNIYIKDPNNNEDFKPGDDIDVNLRFDNNFNSSLDFDILIYLYDIGEDERIEKKKDSLKLKERKHDSVDFKFEIDEDIYDSRYAIFVKAIDEDEGICNEDYVEIQIEREENDVVMKDLMIDSSDTTCGDNILFDVKIDNLGTDSYDDLKLTIESRELNIFTESEEFDLDEYGEKGDSLKEELSLGIPKDAKKGRYNIKVTASYDNDDEKIIKYATIEINECNNLKNITKIEKIITLGKSSNSPKITNNKNIFEKIMISILSLF